MSEADRVSRDSFVGCLIGCAVGDALGAPYEGLRGDQIPIDDIARGIYGEFEGYPRGQFTDDTQLTLATVRGIVQAGAVDPAEIAREIGELWRTAAVIGPGGACMEAGDRYLASGDWRTCGAPPGRAGNGAAMRAAILGLCFRSRDELVAGVTPIARLTHQDSRAVAGAVVVAELTRLLASQDKAAPETILRSVIELSRSLDSVMSEALEQLPGLLAVSVGEALPVLAALGGGSPDLARPAITPYVVPTVAACIWAVLRNPDSWIDGVTEVMRLGGDVDTTGAIVGAVLGARLGVEGIPGAAVRDVHARNKLIVAAHRLWSVYKP